MSKKILIFIFILFSLQITKINAREIANILNSEDIVIFLNFEFDPTFMLTIGFSKGFEIKPLNRDISLEADLSLPIFSLDFKDYRINIGSRISIINFGDFHILNRLGLINTATENFIYSGNNFSIQEGLQFGYFSEEWYIAGEGEYTKMLFTYLEHADNKRLPFKPKDGWYLNTGGNFDFGIQGGYKFFNRYEFSLRTGVTTTETFIFPPFSPIYLNVGGNFYF